MSSTSSEDNNVRIGNPEKGGRGGSKDDDGSILTSIAALKNILMIDTPTKGILNRSASISLQQTRYEERKGYEATIDSLQTKVSELEADLERFKQESAQEKSVNRALQNTNDALLKHKKEVMFQMELLKNRRGKLEDDLTAHIKRLRETKREAEETNTKNEKRIKTIEAEKTAALASASDFESKYKESDKKVQELVSNVAKLKSDAEDTNQRHKQESEDHSRLLQSSKDKLEETEAKVKATENMLEKAQSRVLEFRKSGNPSDDASTLIKLLQQAIAGPTPGSEDHAKNVASVKAVAVEICQGLSIILNAVKSSNDEKAQLVSDLESSKADNIQSKQDIESYEQKCRKLHEERSFLVKDSLRTQSENKQSKMQLESCEQKCQKLQEELESIRAKETIVDEQQEEVEDPKQAENKRPISEVDNVDADQESAKRQKEEEEEDDNDNKKEEEEEGSAVNNNRDDAIDIDEDHDSDGTEPLRDEEEEAEEAAGDDAEGNFIGVGNDLAERQMEEGEAEGAAGDDAEENFIEVENDLAERQLEEEEDDEELADKNCDDDDEVIDVDADEQDEEVEEEEEEAEKDGDEEEDVVEVYGGDDDGDDDDAEQEPEKPSPDGEYITI